MRFPRLTSRRPASPSRRPLIGSVALAATIGVLLSTGVAAFAATTSESQAVRLSAITTDAETSLTEARTAMRDATAVTLDVETAGLALDVASTEIDTGDLRDAIEDLETMDVLPTFILTDVTAATDAATIAVTVKTAVLRAALDKALAAKKAAEEAAAAAERARQEAEAAAAALAAANTVDGAKSTARQLAADRGWGADQFSCLESLWNKESGWNYQALNRSSGAFGIPQSLPGDKMASVGGDWQTNATTQIVWGLTYINGSYGSPCSAWGHSQATGWY